MGSSAAPNVDGIKWFIECVLAEYSAVAAQCCTLYRRKCVRYVGSYARNDKIAQRRGKSGNLYATASVVISPLRAGSGLKIKLIEALSKGKAVVATSTTLQGVADMLAGCVKVADSAPVFASMVSELLADEGNRAKLGASGIAAVSQNFAPEQAYGGIAAVLERTRIEHTDRPRVS